MSHELVYRYPPDLSRRRLSQATAAAGGLAMAAAAAPFLASVAPSERSRA